MKFQPVANQMHGFFSVFHALIQPDRRPAVPNGDCRSAATGKQTNQRRRNASSEPIPKTTMTPAAATKSASTKNVIGAPKEKARQARRGIRNKLGGLQTDNEI